ncbi:AraC family transcriptional regulator, partial [Streptomyces phyllanthi]
MSEREQARWTRTTLGREGRPLDLLTARFARHRYAPHAHDEFSVGICVTGASYIDYRGGGIHTGPGAIIVLAPGEAHTGIADPNGYAYRALYPAPSLLTDGTLTGIPHFRDPVIDDPELAAALRTAHAELSTCPDPLET